MTKEKQEELIEKFFTIVKNKQENELQVLSQHIEFVTDNTSNFSVMYWWPNEKVIVRRSGVCSPDNELYDNLEFTTLKGI